MTRPIWITLLWIMSAGLSAADTPTDRVRALLDQGDIAGLQQEFVQLAAAAAESQSADALRDIHSRLFDTSHPKRIAVVEQWYQEMPNSLFALSAATQVAINKVERLGDGRNTYSSPTNAPKARHLQWAAPAKQARAMADAAYARADGYVPALDAWILTRRFFTRKDTTFVDAFAALMATAPDRASVLRIVDASYTAPVRKRDAVLRACITYADTATDYSIDACMIEVAFKYSLGADLRQTAEDLVALSDDAMFTDEHISILLKQRDRDQAAKAHLAEMYLSLPFGDTDGVNSRAYLMQGTRVSYAVDSPEYRIKIRAKTLKHFSTILADDPFNRFILEEKAKFHFMIYNDTKDLTELAQARAAWEDAMVYGSSNGQIWHLGTYLIEEDAGPEAFAVQQVFYENTIAHLEQSSIYVLYYLRFLQTARDAAETQIAENKDANGAAATRLERLKCPQLRAARLAAAQCRGLMMQDSTCDPAGAFFKHVPQVLAEGDAGSCPMISELFLSDLAYSITPFEAIKLPWSTSRATQD